MTDSIVIKGISQGVLATLPDEGAWSDLVEELIESIEERGAFFKGARLVVDVNAYGLSVDALRHLSERLSAHDVQLVAILCHQDETRQAAEEVGLVTELSEITSFAVGASEDDYEPVAFDSEEYGTAGVLIKRTLRSGRTIRSAGHVVVIGDVNSGAEIIAIGDIIIWGKLRGMVHAGAQGDEKAIVCALDLAPTQLRIASKITIPPQGNRKKTKPEMAQVVGGFIEAVPWSN